MEPWSSGKGKGKGKAAKTLCDIEGCDVLCKGHSPHCGYHDKLVSAMWYQAERDGETAALEQTLNDAHKAKIALADSARNNCIDEGIQVHEIDWA